MHILHLSDVHITDDDERSTDKKSLKALWSGVHRALQKYEPGRKFDFAVLSGDLSQAAQPQEYRDLLTLLRSAVLPRLVKRDRRRVIVVPGNHDVEWGRTRSRPTKFSESGYRQAQQRPEKSWLRVSREGHELTLRRVFKKHYPDRFRNVQAFLNTFYDQDLKSRPHKHFDLLAPPEKGLDWSLHAFPDDGVAFVGLNSCFHNDEYWRGGRINPEAIARIQEWVARESIADLLLVGVWHHGTASDHGSYDCLSEMDLSQICNAGCAVGFHGHTHEAATESIDLFNESLAILSTGSLGAGRVERPNAAANQFSVVRLNRFAADASVYCRVKTTNEYVPKPMPRQMLSHWVRGEEGQPQLPTAAKHVRTFDLGSEGFARVSVDLEGVQSYGELPLASVAGPLSRLSSSLIRFDKRGKQEAVSRRHNGAVHYSFLAGKRYLKHCSWSYTASNALALTQRDLALFREDQSEKEDYISHTVRFPCEELRLALEFPKGYAPSTSSYSATVHRAIPSTQGTEWREVTGSHDRDLELRAAAQGTELVVKGPRVGYRYSIHYRPIGGRPKPSADLENLAALLLQFRTDRESDLRSRLARAFIDGLCAPGRYRASHFDDVEWVVMIWDTGRGKVLPILGGFEPRAWGIGFEPGVGVAGHAFRFSSVATWHHERHGAESLIYVPRRDTSHRWVVAAPLHSSRQRFPIGVVTFATTTLHRSSFYSDLSKLARVARKAPEDELVKVVNVAFWAAIRQQLPEFSGLATNALKRIMR